MTVVFLVFSDRVFCGQNCTVTQLGSDGRGQRGAGSCVWYFLCSHQLYACNCNPMPFILMLDEVWVRDGQVFATFLWYRALCASSGLSKHRTPSDRRFPDFQRPSTRGGGGSSTLLPLDRTLFPDSLPRHLPFLQLNASQAIPVPRHTLCRRCFL